MAQASTIARITGRRYALCRVTTWAVASTHQGSPTNAPDDADQVLRIGFAQACIGASGAARAAVEALFDTPQEDFVIQVRSVLDVERRSLQRYVLTSPQSVLTAFVRGRTRLLAIRPSRRGGTSIRSRSTGSGRHRTCRQWRKSSHHGKPTPRPRHGDPRLRSESSGGRCAGVA